MVGQRQRQAHLVTLLTCATLCDVVAVVLAVMAGPYGGLWGPWLAVHVLLGDAVLFIVHAAARERSHSALAVAILVHTVMPLLVSPVPLFSATPGWGGYAVLLVPLWYVFCALLLVLFRSVFRGWPMRWTAAVVVLVPAIPAANTILVPILSRNVRNAQAHIRLVRERVLHVTKARRVPRVHIEFEDTRGEEDVALETIVRIVPKEPGRLEVECALEAGGRRRPPTTTGAFVRVLADPWDGRVDYRPVRSAHVDKDQMLYLRCQWSGWRPEPGLNVIRVTARRHWWRTPAVAEHLLRRWLRPVEVDPAISPTPGRS